MDEVRARDEFWFWAAVAGGCNVQTLPFGWIENQNSSARKVTGAGLEPATFRLAVTRNPIGPTRWSGLGKEAGTGYGRSHLMLCRLSYPVMIQLCEPKSTGFGSQTHFP